MLQKILVIGGNSFSGAHFAAEMVHRGHDVLSISRSKRVEQIFLPERWAYKKKFTVPFQRIDLNSETESLADLLSDFRPELVVNFAAQGMVAESWERPLDWYRTNVLAQIRLHDLLRRCGSLVRYIHITTPEVYGTTKGWVSEGTAFNPSTPYAASRAACDLHLFTYFNGHNFPVLFTRAANVFGPGQQLYRIIPRTMIAALTGRKLDLHGGGTSKRSFINIQDVIEATYKIATDGRIGECYHISTNEVKSISDVVGEIATMFNLRLEDLCNISEERLGKDHSYMLDSGKIRSTLGWSEEISFKQGLVDVKNWVEDNLHEIMRMPLHYKHKE